MPSCECGCGKDPGTYTATNKRLGYVKGQPKRFVHGHNGRSEESYLRGPDNPRWNGGRKRHSHGYWLKSAPEHPRADMHGYVYEHILVAERALGKLLPPGAEVHHVNGDKADNRPSNLVVCQDHAYHMMLHARQRRVTTCQT